MSSVFWARGSQGMQVEVGGRKRAEDLQRSPSPGPNAIKMGEEVECLGNTVQYIPTVRNDQKIIY